MCCSATWPTPVGSGLPRRPPRRPPPPQLGSRAGRSGSRPRRSRPGTWRTRGGGGGAGGETAAEARAAEHAAGKRSAEALAAGGRPAEEGPAVGRTAGGGELDLERIKGAIVKLYREVSAETAASPDRKFRIGLDRILGWVDSAAGQGCAADCRGGPGDDGPQLSEVAATLLAPPPGSEGRGGGAEGDSPAGTPLARSEGVGPEARAPPVQEEATVCPASEGGRLRGEEEIVNASQASPPRSRRYTPQPRFRVACSGLSGEEKLALQKLCARMPNTQYMSSNSDGSMKGLDALLPPETTHFVARSADGRSLRTMRYMASLLRGCWIVGFDWVKCSIEKATWAPEAPFELKGDRIWLATADTPARARAFALRRKEALRNGKRPLAPRVFEGQRIFLGQLKQEIDGGTGGVLNSQHQYRLMQDMVVLGGGTVVQSVGATLGAPGPPVVGVSSQWPLPLQSARALRLIHGCPFVSFYWLCDSISNFGALPFPGYGGEPLSDIDNNAGEPEPLEASKGRPKRPRAPQSSAWVSD